jgi:hypothetical protein
MKGRVGIFLTAFILAVSLPALAQGARDGTGPIHIKAPFNYAGAIISCLEGDGILLATEDDGNVVIYGIGPMSYWEQYGGKPGIGELITVEGYSVSFNDEVRNIAWSITLSDGTVVTLRNDAGLPLWRSVTRSGAGYPAYRKQGR